MSDAERFMEKFIATWSAPEPESFAALFHPEGELLHPGMKAPLPASEVPGYIRRLKTICPDLSLAVDRWQAGEDYVLIEWTMGGNMFGQDVRWSGADRFTLRGDGATYGVAYFDTVPLWALIEPSMKRETTLEQAAADLVAAS